MEPEGRLVDRIELENGLSVNFIDRSRPVAGDRCQVQLLVDVPVEVKREYLEPCLSSAAALESFVASLGNKISFQLVKTRNFIDAKEAENMLQRLKDEFLQSNREYLSNPDFARKFIVKKYAEWKREAACRESHKEAVARSDQGSEE